MKATLKFKLPEDQHEFDLARRARNYYLVLYNLDNHLRNTMKWQELSEEKYKALEETRDKLTGLLHEYNLTLE